MPYLLYSKQRTTENSCRFPAQRIGSTGSHGLLEARPASRVRTHVLLQALTRVCASSYLECVRETLQGGAERQKPSKPLESKRSSKPPKTTRLEHRIFEDGLNQREPGVVTISAQQKLLVRTRYRPLRTSDKISAFYDKDLRHSQLAWKKRLLDVDETRNERRNCAPRPSPLVCHIVPSLGGARGGADLAPQIRPRYSRVYGGAK